MAPIELLLPNALFISSEALSRETSAPNPQLEVLGSSIQTPIKAGDRMEGWVDPLLSLGFEPSDYRNAERKRMISRPTAIVYLYLS